ncbi:MAG: hypothetical protein HY675_18555 [Chloroflexi bacterium]|nr:hypothetical protein [Chloroflexota bacterium]
MDRAGLPTVLITALLSVASRAGTNRVVRGCRFQHPLGDPSRTAEGESKWRLRVVRTAVQALATRVDGPTIFEVD